MEVQNSEFGNVDLSDEEIGDDSPETVLANDADNFLRNNAFRIVYQPNNFFLSQIQQMIKYKQTINLRPAYQRRLRWSEKNKSMLIESMLLNVPIPPIFLFESEAARYEVMDGQQRMNTISEFLNDLHTLSGLEILTSLNGSRYSQCTPQVQRALERASVSAIVLLLESDTERFARREIANSERRFSTLDIRRLVFNRINTGGTNLNPQEVRNALNPGPFNEMITNLSRWDKFTDTFEIPPCNGGYPRVQWETNERGANALYKSMKDCEIVLRYFALRDDSNIRGSMRAMLDRAMEVDRAQEDVKCAEKEYMNLFSLLYELFDGRPFRLPSKGSKGYTISVLLYDGLMVAAHRLLSDNPNFEFDSEKISIALNKATDDDDAYVVIVARANTAEAVRKRIDLMVGVLGGQNPVFSKFHSITRDFSDDLDSIRDMVSNSNQRSIQSKVRIKSTQSAILLIAADQEEYVRQMAYEHCLGIAASVQATKRLKEEAWKTTFRRLAQARVFNGGNVFRAQARIDSEETIKSLFSFMSGEFDGDILHLVIRNQQNMTPKHLNAMFKLGGVDNISNKICELDCLNQHLKADDSRMAYGLFLHRQNEFFSQRNSIAHSPAAVSSVSADVVESHIALFDATAQAMTKYLADSCLHQ